MYKSTSATPLPCFCREWYCADKNFFTEYLSKLITGWIPTLLVALWQVLVLPVTMIVLVQVRTCACLHTFVSVGMPFGSIHQRKGCRVRRESGSAGGRVPSALWQVRGM